MISINALQNFARDSRKTALITGTNKLSYSDLNRRSNSFAAFLLTHLPKDNSPILIYGHKEEAFLCCIYGALKAGHSYIPVDITMPIERISQIAADAAPAVAVDFTGSLTRAVENTAIIDSASLSKIFDEYPAEDIQEENWVKKEDYCYILFTSGSTGKPKGVPISRKNIDNFGDCFLKWFDPDKENQVCTNLISYSFDVSVISVYFGIALGKTLLTIDKTAVENMKLLMERFADSDLGYFVSTPSFAEMCVTSSLFDAKLLPNLKTFFFAGEILGKKLARTLKERFPGCRVINGYGPTETTVVVTATEVTEEMLDDELSLPIGKAFDEVRLIVADPDGKELPDGEKGELLIISDNVADGYYKNSRLTEKLFFDYSADGITKRGYRSGDKCFCRNGQYYFCGRLDYQIKLNGYRIELEDIENSLAKVENISRAVALPVFEGDKVSHIAAFVLLKENEELSPLKQMMAIKEKAKQFLPFYMIPRKIIVKDSFPTNTNGKVDRKLLAAEL